MNEGFNECNKKFYEISEHASITFSKYHLFEMKLNKVSDDLLIKIEKYMNFNFNC